jgi:hypothetical protein
MIDCGSLEYAQARVLARHGQHLDEAGWRRIETLRDLAALLEQARGTALQPWLVGITSGSNGHQIESTLRRHGRALVAEVVAWMPEAWQPSLGWCAHWPDLAPLQHLARGGPAPTWMLDDDVFRDLTVAEPAERAATLATGPLAPLAAAWTEPQTIGAVWLAEWQRRLPRPLPEADQALTQVLHAMLDHGRSFANAAPSQGWLLRRALQSRLTLLLRRSMLDPALAFIHVALGALEIERLRAELLRRALFARWKAT